MIIKVEDLARARTKSTRNDKWLEESHDIDVDKANEIEITVYDKPGDHPLPIGMLWVRISDIAEEMRRKKIEQDISASGWVSADHVENQPGGQQYAFSPQGIGASPSAPGGMYGAAGPAPGAPIGGDPNAAPVIDSWFALEPVGQIRLGLSFGRFLILKIEGAGCILTEWYSEIQPKQTTFGSWPRTKGCCSPAERGGARDVRAQVRSTAVL